MKKVFENDGVPSILFVFEHAGCGTQTYVVPLEVAIELQLSSYDGQELDGDEDIFDKIEQYEVEHINTYNTD